MKSYPSYKDSGVEWIGEIPSGWDKVKTNLITENLDSKRVPLNAEQRGEMEGSIPYWGSNGIIDYVNDYIFDEELLLVGEDGAPFFDKCNNVSFFVDGKVWVNNHIHILKLKSNVLPKYLCHSFNCVDYGEYITGSTRDKLTQSDLDRIPHLIPPFFEQQQIVSFLDHKTQQIDDLIEKTEKKIELLKEQRTSLINHCVTKGLNPDVEMKDSGVEWIGEIPSEWEIRRLSTYGTFSKGRGISRDEIKLTGIPCIRYGEIYTKYNRIIFNPLSFIDEESSRKSEKIKKGNILFTGSGETIDEIGKTVVYYGEDDVYVGGDIIILELQKNLNPLFISYILNSSYVNFQKSIMGRGEIVVHIYSKNLREIQTALPPLPEQQQIVSYLDEQTKKIDSTVEKETQRIELLKEYRQSLISEVVTGKIDVREWTNDTQKLS